MGALACALAHGQDASGLQQQLRRVFGVLGQLGQQSPYGSGQRRQL